MKPTLAICAIVLTLAGIACADLVLVFRGSGASGDAPIVADPPAQFVAVDGAIDFTPTLTQGDNIEWTATNLPSGASINSSTGAVAGTCDTAAVDIVEITAENTVSGDTYTIYLPVHVYSSQVTIDSTWKTNNGPAPYILSTANTNYVLAENVTTDGSAFGVFADDISLDGSGYTITYDNATPIAIDNASFETVDAGDGTHADGWDFSTAPNATRHAGTFLYSEMWDGDYSVRFNDTTANEEIQCDTAITLQANTTYCLSAMFEYGGQTGSNPGVKGYVRLVGTGGETTRETAWSATNQRGMQLVEATFTTGGVNENYTVRAGIEGHASADRPFFIDDIKVGRYLNHGITVGSNGSGDVSDISTTGTDSEHVLITDVTVTQGQDSGPHCSGVRTKGSRPMYVHCSNITVAGNNSHCIRHSGENTSGTYYLLDSTLTSNIDTITSRDNFNGAMYFEIFQVASTVADCTFLNGPHAGIFMSAGYDHLVTRNSFSLKGKYSNNFAILPGGGNVIGNTITASTGDFTSRGIAGQATTRGNTVTVQSLANNQEYGGAPIGGTYLYQSENPAANTTVENEAYTLVGSAGGHCLRPSKLTSGVHTHDNLTLVVDVSAFPSNSSFTLHPSCLYLTQVDGNFATFENLTMTTNCAVALFDEFSAMTMENVDLKNCTFSYVNNGIDHDHAWVSGYRGSNALAQWTVTNPTYTDAATKTWIDSPVYNVQQDTEDSTNVSMAVRHEMTVVMTDGSNPIANTAVTVTDEQGNTIYNSTTNGSGVITFTATEYTRINGTRLDYSDHTFAISGYADEVVTISPSNDTDRTITVEMTEE